MSTRTAIVQDINLRRLSTDSDIPNLRWQLQYHSHSLFTCVVCCYHQIYRLINVLSLSLIRIFCSRKWCFLSVAWMGRGGGAFIRDGATNGGNTVSPSWMIVYSLSYFILTFTHVYNGSLDLCIVVPKSLAFVFLFYNVRIKKKSRLALIHDFKQFLS